MKTASTGDPYLKPENSKLSATTWREVRQSFRKLDSAYEELESWKRREPDLFRFAIANYKLQVRGDGASLPLRYACSLAPGDQTNVSIIVGKMREIATTRAKVRLVLSEVLSDFCKHAPRLRSLEHTSPRLRDRYVSYSWLRGFHARIESGFAKIDLDKLLPAPKNRGNGSAEFSLKHGINPGVSAFLGSEKKQQWTPAIYYDITIGDYYTARVLNKMPCIAWDGKCNTYFIVDAEYRRYPIQQGESRPITYIKPGRPMHKPVTLKGVAYYKDGLLCVGETLRSAKAAWREAVVEKTQRQLSGAWRL